MSIKQTEGKIMERGKDSYREPSFSLFYKKISGPVVTRISHNRPCFRLSISRQPLFIE